MIFTVRRLKETGLRLWRSDNGGRYTRIDPKLFCEPPEVRGAVDWAHGVEPITPPEAVVAEIPDAVICQRGLVMDAPGSIIGESLINLASRAEKEAFKDVMALEDYIPVRFEEGNRYSGEMSSFAPRSELADGTYVLLEQKNDDNYGHWLVESLPRVELIRHHFDLGGLKFILHRAGAEMDSVYRDSLAEWRITPDQIRVVGPEPVRVKHMLYPAPLTVAPWVKAPLAVEVLAGIGARARAAAADDGARKLFVRRHPGSRRQLLNEDEIAAVLEARGYRTVHPASMSFRDQVAAFAPADLVVGSLGAELSNAAFARRGVRMLALTSEFMLDDFYWDLVSHKSGAYFSLHGRAEKPELRSQSDYRVPMDRFLEVLNMVERDASM